MLRRTHLHLDDEVVELLRRRAIERGISMSALIREMVRQQLAPSTKKLSVKDLGFVGSGKGATARKPVSEHHDGELAKAYVE